MGRKHTRRCSTSLVILTLHQNEQSERNDIEQPELSYSWWECKIVPPLWEVKQQSLKQLYMCYSAIPVLKIEICPHKDLFVYVHIRIRYNSPKLETTSWPITHTPTMAQWFINSAIKRMNLRNIMPSETGQTQKANTMILFI